MPNRDPLPSPRHSTMRRFWRIFRLLVLLAVLIAAIAVLLVQRGDPTPHIHMLIATGLGVGVTVLLGTTLMTLVFLSSSSGHDDEVREFHQENIDESPITTARPSCGSSLARATSTPTATSSADGC